MTALQAHHFELTKLRAAAYQALFGTKPAAVFPHHQMPSHHGAEILVDIFIYPLEMEGYGEFVVAVTNGMSDAAMEEDGLRSRREIVQYLPTCTPGHAVRLLEMAWFPHTQKMIIDAFSGIEWHRPAMPDTPWTSALFLHPIISEHHEFTIELEGEECEFLWHVPVSDRELNLIKDQGLNTFLERMEAAEVPFIFDEEVRQELV
ncbi:MAG: suppressor of fused domain protein [Fimbriiglobus sp.]